MVIQIYGYRLAKLDTRDGAVVKKVEVPILAASSSLMPGFQTHRWEYLKAP